jgi:endonuclease
VHIDPQTRVLATDRGIDCVTVDYDVLMGADDPTQRLFQASGRPEIATGR